MNKQVLSFLLLTSLASFGFAQSENLLTKADEAYGDGSCDKAISLYDQVRQQPNATSDSKDLSTFRIAYCHYSAGNIDGALTEFDAFLRRQPDSDEARLRYAETLLSKEKYDEALENAKRITDPKHKLEARLVIARAYLETQETDKAIKELKIPTGTNPDLDPVVEYWRGVAYLQAFNLNSAESSFNSTIKMASENHWTKSAAESWLQNIEDSRVWIHPRVGLSYGSDTNIAGVLYKTTRNDAPDSSTAVKDTYTSADATLTSMPLRIGKNTFTPSISGYSLKYGKADNKSYNNSSYSVDLTALFPLTYRWNLTANASYSDLSYNNKHYLYYSNVGLGTVFAFTKTLSANLSYKNTKAIGDYPSVTNTATLGLGGETSYFYWLTSYSTATASADNPTYTQSAGVFSVSAGSSFSNYTANTMTLGIGRVLPYSFDIYFQAASTNTQYVDERVPPVNAAYVTMPRKDTTTVYQLNLSRAIIERRLTATLSYSSTKNVSEGYQGLMYSSGSSADYNYAKTQTSIYLAYGY